MLIFFFVLFALCIFSVFSRGEVDSVLILSGFGEFYVLVSVVKRWGLGSVKGERFLVLRFFDLAEVVSVEGFS